MEGLASDALLLELGARAVSTIFKVTIVELKPYDIPVSKLLEGYLNGENWREQVEGFKKADEKLLAALEDELTKGSAPP